MTRAGEARTRLERLAVEWHRRRLLGAAFAVTAAVLLAAAAAAGAGAARDTQLVAGLLALLGGLAAAWRAVRRPVIDARTVARHLDRVHPTLEESAALIVEDDATLTALARLQRDRVAAELLRLAPDALPNRPFRRAAAASVLMLAVAGAAAVVGYARESPGALPVSAAEDPNDGTHGDPAAPRITRLQVEIVPPPYTGRPPRLTEARDVEAEDGARVTWHLETSGDADALLVTEQGDTARFADGAASLTAARPLLYRIVLRSAAGVRTTDLHHLAVRADRAPEITLTAPPPRTVLAPGEPLRVRVRGRVRDDYGVADAELVATVTTGRGESVRFREERMPLARGARGASLEVATVLDLATLGLAPGDELYFHIRAVDRRVPAPNESRSETFFVSLLDTAALAAADFGGLPVSRLPEFFRSQRQIIIDTERLIAERPRLAAAEVRRRSADIGLDQELLRLRYGAIVGDETEGGSDDDGAHMHDTEENATLLADSVKLTLKDALAAMWEAERRLRTYEPAAALPHEYQALEALKAVQQAARAYLPRVGPELPPLDPAKRLTGELDQIVTRRESRSAERRDPDLALRRALPVLAAHGAGSPDGAGAPAAIEDAAAELGARAAADPGRYLAPLRQLRRLIDAARRGDVCPACADSAAAGIRRVLPPPQAAPAAGARGAGARYFELLGEW